MSKKALTRHHPFCRSRGDNEKVVYWPDSFHKTWHILFQNLLPDEIHHFIDLISDIGTSWNTKRLNELIEKIKKGEIKK